MGVESTQTQAVGVAVGGTGVEVFVGAGVSVAVGVFVGGTGVFVDVAVDVTVGVATVQGTWVKFS